ncbi:MAG TPA: ROK family protein, partial [bacterium]|nr:ROK family protein [bacterium]
MNANSQVRVGVDVGGTKIALALVDANNDIISEVPRFEVATYKKGDDLVERLVQEAETLYEANGYSRDDVQGIGIGSPGPLDLKTGTVLNTPNMPMLVNYGLKDAVNASARLPVEVNNDANCFVLGEALAGKAKEGDIVLGVTLGTGYGFGIVFNRRVYEGSTGTAAEIAYNPYLGTTLEKDYISGNGLSRMYAERSGKKIAGPEIARKAENGEDKAIDALKEFGEHLGNSFAWFVNILDPDFIVVGGSIATNWEFFQERMFDTLYKYI